LKSKIGHLESQTAPDFFDRMNRMDGMDGMEELIGLVATALSIVLSTGIQLRAKKGEARKNRIPA
jgi:hypothetical protein